MIIINAENNLAASCFCETLIYTWGNTKKDKLIILLIKEHVKLIKSDSKDMYNVTTYFYFI